MGRTTGRPPSGNGASSFHIWWDTSERFASVEVTLEILDPPSVDRLYFFALQASFWSQKHEGGAHTGLQWNQRHAGSTAVNWGGYDSAGSILRGTTSPLPSTPDDPNTRDYRWAAATPYKLSIGPRSSDLRWPAAVEDLATGERVIIRELECDGDHLRNPVVWSEVFADCDHPPVAVRWSDPHGLTVDGRSVSIRQGRVSYQSHDAGGCANTSIQVDDRGVLQRSATERSVRQDDYVPWGIS